MEKLKKRERFVELLGIFKGNGYETHDRFGTGFVTIYSPWHWDSKAQRWINEPLRYIGYLAYRLDEERVDCLLEASVTEREFKEKMQSGQSAKGIRP